MDVWLVFPHVWIHLEVDGTHRHGFDWIWCGLNGTMLTVLQDGVTSYAVRVENRSDRRYNDVWFKEAKLNAWGNEIPDSHGVPDAGASVLMLRIGILNILLLRQRTTKAPIQS